MESNSIINHQNCQGERHDSQNESTQGEEQRPSKATITRCDLSTRFFCNDAALFCEFESDKI